MRVASVRGCPQGGVLSLLLWNLTVDKLLWDLNEVRYYSIGFVDDIAIIIRDKFPSTVFEVLQNALKRLETTRTTYCYQSFFGPAGLRLVNHEV